MAIEAWHWVKIFLLPMPLIFHSHAFPELVIFFFHFGFGNDQLELFEYICTWLGLCV